MEKIIAVVLSLVLMISLLSGCGSNPSNSDSENPTNASENEIAKRAVANVYYYTAAESFAGGTGTEADPFQISEPGHLVLLHEMLEKEEAEVNFDDTYVKGHYILTADITLNDTSDYDNWSTSAPTYGWEPIGTNVISNVFAGVLDGNGHKISGLFIDADTAKHQTYYGLFSTMNGIVKNLTVEQSYICVSGGIATVGTIAGRMIAKEAVIENCNVTSEIKLYNDCEAGGIAGSVSDSTVSGCSFSGSITQLDSNLSYIGGICGSNGGITGNANGINHCTFSGSISTKGTSGGIVGSGDNVINCVNKGSVTGDRAGGIIGILLTAGTDLQIEEPRLTIDNCINEGTVTGTTMAGGIIAQMTLSESDFTTTISNCRNMGQVICDELASGIIGTLSVERCGTVNVENCMNHANISSKGKTSGVICEVLGGILQQEGTVNVSGCKNTGDVISEGQYSSGIVTYFMVMGKNVDLRFNLDNCSNEGAVKSTQYAGGILGFSNVGFNAEVSEESMTISDSTMVVLNNCNNTGSVTATTSNSMAGGIVSVLGFGYISTRIEQCVNSGNIAIEFTLTEEKIAEMQDASWTEIYQIGGGIIGRIGDALKLTTAEGFERNADNVNTPNGNIVISGCANTGKITAPDYSYILNSFGEPLYVNYLGGVVGQCSATNGYAFRVENCTYTGADRGLGDTTYPDLGSKN